MQMPFSMCQNMQNNMQTLNPICKILQGLYFAYFAYICTAHFADDGSTYCHWNDYWYIHVRMLPMYVLVRTFRNFCMTVHTGTYWYRQSTKSTYEYVTVRVCTLLCLHLES